MEQVVDVGRSKTAVRACSYLNRSVSDELHGSLMSASGSRNAACKARRRRDSGVGLTSGSWRVPRWIVWVAKSDEIMPGWGW